MKKYYGYSETSNKLDWAYFKGKFKYPTIKQMQKDKYVDRGTISIRFVGFCYKADLINIASEKGRGGKNWVRERVGRTGNDTDIKLCNEHPNCIIVRIDNVGWGTVPNDTILEIIPIEKKEDKT